MRHSNREDKDRGKSATSPLRRFRLCRRRQLFILIAMPRFVWSAVVAIAAVHAATLGICAGAADPPPFVIENAGSKEIAFSNDGVLRISKTSGWIRTRGILSDFVLTAEFSLASPDTQAEIGIRTVNVSGEWPRRGYRIALSTRQPAADMQASSLPMTKVSGKDVPTLTIGVWHELTVSAAGPVITVTLDREVVGVYEIRSPCGALLFTARKGTIQFRNIAVKSALLNVPEVSEFKTRKDFQPPKLVREVKPNYTWAAMQRHAQGPVEFKVVILVDGTVGPVILTGPLDPELEHQGLYALQHWKFEPARLNGQPIAVVTNVELSFTLK